MLSMTFCSTGGPFGAPEAWPVTKCVTHREERAGAVTKSPERWVDAVGSVGGCHHDHMCPLLQPVHEGQQLRHDATLHLPMCLQGHKGALIATALQRAWQPARQPALYLSQEIQQPRTTWQQTSRTVSNPPGVQLNSGVKEMLLYSIVKCRDSCQLLQKKKTC